MTATLEPIMTEFANQWFVGLRVALTHGVSNKAFDTPLTKFMDAANTLYQEEDRAQFRLAGHLVYINDIPLKLTSGLHDHIQKIGPKLDKLQATELTITKTCTEDTTRELFIRMAEAITNVDKPDAPDFEPPEGFKVLNCTITEDELPFRERALHAYIVGVLSVKDLVSNIERERPSRLATVKRAIQHIVAITAKDPAFMLGLIRLPRYHGKLFTHLINTGIIVTVVGHRLGLERGAIAELAFNAAIHNLDLSGERSQNQTLRQILRIYRGDINARKRLCFIHEVYQLPSNALGPQLVRMASDFELLTTKGDEYGPVLLDEAMRRIKADERFDPELVETFWAALGVYPVGSTVALSNGSLAVVMELPDDGRSARSPIVRLVADADGNPINEGIIDLTSPDAPFITDVVSSEDLNLNITSLFLA